MPLTLSQIPVRLKEMRRSQADLARHLELDPSSLTKTLKGDRRVQPAELVKIERFFGDKLQLEVVETAPATARRRTAPAKVPVYGYPVGTGEAIALAEDRVLEELEPPPHWSGNGELIYVRVIGGLMHPRYRSGEIVPVRLQVPPADGCDCLVEFHDHSAIVRTYHGERQGQVWLEQFGEDAKTYGVDGASVKRLHAVWRPGMA